MVCTENVLKHLADEEVKKYVSRKCLKYFKNSKVHLDCHAETSHSLSFYKNFVAQEDQLNSEIQVFSGTFSQKVCIILWRVLLLHCLIQIL